MKKLTKKQIDEIFEQAKEQYDYALALYKVAFPDFDDIKALDGHPKVSVETGKYLFDKAISFDREHHPDVVNGGLWLNKGFSSNDDVPDWEIDISLVQIEYEIPQ